MFFGSPEPMKKWHLSAHAPQRTQMSMKSLKERKRFSRSAMPSRTVFFHPSGSFQSSSVTAHSRAFGRSRTFRFFVLPG